MRKFVRLEDFDSVEFFNKVKSHLNEALTLPGSFSSILKPS